MPSNSPKTLKGICVFPAMASFSWRPCQSLATLSAQSSTPAKLEIRSSWRGRWSKCWRSIHHCYINIYIYITYNIWYDIHIYIYYISYITSKISDMYVHNYRRVIAFSKNKMLQVPICDIGLQIVWSIHIAKKKSENLQVTWRLNLLYVLYHQNESEYSQIISVR